MLRSHSFFSRMEKDRMSLSVCLDVHCSRLFFVGMGVNESKGPKVTLGMLSACRGFLCCMLLLNHVSLLFSVCSLSDSLACFVLMFCSLYSWQLYSDQNLVCSVTRIPYCLWSFACLGPCA